MKKFVISVLCLFLTALLFCVEIPLQGTGGLTMGYVDMNKLFQEYPAVKKAKLDYDKLSDDKKNELAAMETDVAVTKSSFTELETGIKQLKQDLLASKTLKQQLSEQILRQQEQLKQQEEINQQTLREQEEQRNQQIQQEQQQRQAVSSSTPAASPVQDTSSSTTISPGLLPAESAPNEPAPQSAQSASTEAVSAIPVISSSTLTDMKDQYVKLLSTIQETETRISEKETEISLARDTLAKKQEDLKTFKKRISKDLKEYEQSKTLSLMGDLYKIIEDLAKEENISIVLEKTNVLYGTGGVDLTNKVLDRMRGK